jgi:hypothetical protein
MTRTRKPKPDDLLTARDIADEFGWPVTRAESLVRTLGRRGDVPIRRIEGFRHVFVRRGDLMAQIQSGGTT